MRRRLLPARCRPASAAGAAAAAAPRAWAADRRACRRVTRREGAGAAAAAGVAAPPPASAAADGALAFACGWWPGSAAAASAPSCCCSAGLASRLARHSGQVAALHWPWPPLHCCSQAARQEVCATWLHGSSLALPTCVEAASSGAVHQPQIAAAGTQRLQRRSSSSPLAQHSRHAPALQGPSPPS